MKSTSTSKVIFLLFAVLCCSYILSAQTVLPYGPDTTRTIQIIRGKSLREKTIDSATSYQTIAGDVILKEGLTLFYCDSASINKRTNVLEAYGNIHINQNDSIHTYSQYLKYIGTDRIAYLKKDVRLTDNKGTLYTQELEYDLKTSVGKYKSGGKVVNGKTVLTSTEGVYYAETKDVFFKKNVHLADPKYDIRNDTLLYNTQTQVTSWNTPTNIKSKNGGDVYSTNGTYDLKNGKAFFGNRTIIKDSTRTYVADESAYDELSGIAQLRGNAVIKDSVNGYTVLGNEIYLDKNTSSFLATQKPVLIFKGEADDSTFIAADTLFSGIEKRDSLGRKIIVTKDTLKNSKVVNVNDSALLTTGIRDSKGKPMATANRQPDSVTDSLHMQTDSTNNTVAANNQPVKKEVKAFTNIDSSLAKQDKKLIAATPTPPTKPDSLAAKTMAKNKPLTDTAATKKTDSLNIAAANSDSVHLMVGKKPAVIKKDTLEKKSGSKAAKDTAIRYFIAFHKVRIFNDSLQSVCDSLYYSSEDSIFKLFKDPLVFASKSQIAGDTIYMYTKNKKAERLYVFENGIIINKANDQMYNQIAGRTLNGYFKAGELDYVRAKGSPAESVFYPQDNDSAYIGMNRGKGDVIDIYFLNKEVNRVKFINQVDGTMYPLRQIPEDQRFLKNYKWQDKRRPKNKLELFE